jgi:MYXO-CTERM domain-containing protein
MDCRAFLGWCALTLSLGFGGFAAIAASPTPAGVQHDDTQEPRKKARYDHVSAIRLRPKDRDELTWLRQHAVRAGLEGRQLELYWQSERLPELTRRGIEFEILVANIQEAIDAEEARLAHRQRGVEAVDFTEYLDFETFDAYLDELASDVPTRATVEKVGDSLEKRAIRVLTISELPAETSAPSMLILGTQHAREWLANHALLCALDTIARNPDERADIAALTQRARVYAIPMTNPDGYVYTWTDDRMWRKNRAASSGVDLNRNYGSGWGMEGSGSDPQAEDYRGPNAFSEPESQLVRDFVGSHPDLKAFLDVHAYGQVLLWPYGFTNTPITNDAAYDELANKMADRINGVHQQGYTPTRTIDFWVAAGIASDWVADTFGEQGMAFSLEVRPKEASFVQPASEIIPTCEEILEGILELAATIVPPPDDDDDGSSDASSEESDDSGDTGTQASSDDASEGDETETSSTETPDDHTEAEDSSIPSDSSTADEGDESDDDASGDTEPNDSNQQEADETQACACSTGQRASSNLGALLALCFVALKRRRHRMTQPT